MGNYYSHHDLIQYNHKLPPHHNLKDSKLNGALENSRQQLADESTVAFWRIRQIKKDDAEKLLNYLPTSHYQRVGTTVGEATEKYLNPIFVELKRR